MQQEPLIIKLDVVTITPYEHTVLQSDPSIVNYLKHHAMIDTVFIITDADNEDINTRKARARVIAGTGRVIRRYDVTYISKEFLKSLIPEIATDDNIFIYTNNFRMD